MNAGNYTITRKCQACGKTHPVPISVKPTENGGGIIYREIQARPDTVGNAEAWGVMARYCEEAMPSWEPCGQCQQFTLQLIVGYPHHESGETQVEANKPSKQNA